MLAKKRGAGYPSERVNETTFCEKLRDFVLLYIFTEF